LAVNSRINEACHRFELAWQAGQRPRVEDYLRDTPEADRSALLRELVALDIAFRQQVGEQPQVEAYRAYSPSLDPAQRADPSLAQVQPLPLSGRGSSTRPPQVPGYEILGELAPPLQHPRIEGSGNALAWGAAFSSDGKLILTTDGTTVRLWDAATLRPIGPALRQEKDVWTVPLHPDGSLFLTAKGVAGSLANRLGAPNCAVRLWKIPAPVEGDAT
jgi:hypothetical protein